MTLEELIASIDQRLADAEVEMRRLAAARDSLKNDPAAPSGRRGSARRRKPRTVAKVVPAGKLLAVIAERPGTTTSGLTKHVDGDQQAVLQLLKEAEAEGKVRREGERRGTRWWVVTEPSDDEKLAARIRELEAAKAA